MSFTTAKTRVVSELVLVALVSPRELDVVYNIKCRLFPRDLKSRLPVDFILAAATIPGLTWHTRGPVCHHWSTPPELAPRYAHICRTDLQFSLLRELNAGSMIWFSILDITASSLLFTCPTVFTECYLVRSLCHGVHGMAI